MSSNTPGSPGGYPNYPPQPDQGYGSVPSPSYGGRTSGSYDPPQQYGPPTRLRPEPRSAQYYGQGREPASDPAPKSRRGLWIGLIAVVVVLLLVGGGALALSAYQSSEAAKPVSVANAFCQDLKTQNYTDAYSMLSSTYQAAIKQ